RLSTCAADCRPMRLRHRTVRTRTPKTTMDERNRTGGIFASGDAVRDRDGLRMLEALLFASEHPLSLDELRSRLPQDLDVPALLDSLAEMYRTRGVNLVHVAGKWTFRTAEDLAYLLHRERVEERKLSRAALE